MSRKQTYELLVRGEKVRLEFWKVTDSRRVAMQLTKKRPNLFNVRAATVCRLTNEKDSPYRGVAFCWRSDYFKPQVGREKALKDALRVWRADRAMREFAGAVYQAYAAEDKKRREAHVKKPKPRLGRQKTRVRLQLGSRRKLVEIIGELAQALNKQLREAGPESGAAMAPAPDAGVDARSTIGKLIEEAPGIWKGESNK